MNQNAMNVPMPVSPTPGHIRLHDEIRRLVGVNQALEDLLSTIKAAPTEVAPPVSDSQPSLEEVLQCGPAIISGEISSMFDRIDQISLALTLT